MNILSQALADPVIAAQLTAAIKADPLPARRAAYVSAMRKFDHQFEFADDHRVWRAGRDELVRLRSERDAVDPDRTLWLANMHESFHHG